MSDQVQKRGRAVGVTARDAAVAYDLVRATLEAADQVACEFIHKHRLEFLVQAIRREHETVDESKARELAQRYVTIDRERFGA